MSAVFWGSRAQLSNVQRPMSRPMSLPTQSLQYYIKGHQYELPLKGDIKYYICRAQAHESSQIPATRLPWCKSAVTCHKGIHSQQVMSLDEKRTAPDLQATRYVA